MPVASLLIVSNGHGEDSIAAEIVRRLPSSIRAEAYPTLGDGRAYVGVCPIVGPRAHLPSEGWRNVKGSIARDAFGNGLATVWPGLRFLRAARRAYDHVVVVGDMIGVYGCWVTGHGGITYIDVYKTGFGRNYLWLDAAILRRTARRVFCRTKNLADQLNAAGVDASAPGNVMMDTIPRQNLELARSRPSGLTLLPGSRRHAVKNFILQADALRLLPADLLPDLFLAVASSLDAGEFLRHAEGLPITVVPGAAMGDALDASDLVLSQAGTATVQAIGLGRPAITFRSAEDRPSRIADESRLFGEAREVVDATPQALAAALERLLRDPEELARRSAIGRARIGPPGAMDVILTSLKA